jgi:hypothetical protein
MRNIVDYNSLYWMHDPLATKPLRLIGHQKWIDQEMANNLFYGSRQPLEHVKLEPQSGRQITDILWTSGPPIFCVSQKVIDILHKNLFTGWGTYPVEVYNHDGKYLHGYQGFSVKSYAGKQDFSRCSIEMKPPAPGITPKKYYIGTYFDESKWDGSDIFRIQHAIIIFKKKVVQEFKKHKITNVRFELLPKTETSESIYESLKKSGSL